MEYELIDDADLEQYDADAYAAPAAEDPFLRDDPWAGTAQQRVPVREGFNPVQGGYRQDANTDYRVPFTGARPQRTLNHVHASYSSANSMLRR